jgi:hypothetical protein
MMSGLSRRKQGFDSPWARQLFFPRKLMNFGPFGGWPEPEMCQWYHLLMKMLPLSVL